MSAKLIAEPIAVLALGYLAWAALSWAVSSRPCPSTEVPLTAERGATLDPTPCDERLDWTSGRMPGREACERAPVARAELTWHPMTSCPTGLRCLATVSDRTLVELRGGAMFDGSICLLSSATVPVETIDISGVQVAGDVYVVRAAGAVDESLCRRPLPIAAYPLACTPARAPAPEARVDPAAPELILSGLAARRIYVRGAFGALSASEIDAQLFDALQTSFSGCANLEFARLGTVELAHASLGGGLTAFSSHVEGNFDLASARITHALNLMNLSVGGTLQLSHARLQERRVGHGPFCNRLDGVVWDLIGVHAQELEAKELRVASRERVYLDNAVVTSGVDIRELETRGPRVQWVFRGAHLGGQLSFTPRREDQRTVFDGFDDVELSAPFALRVGPSCAPSRRMHRQLGMVTAARGDSHDLELAGVHDTSLLERLATSSDVRRHYARREQAESLIQGSPWVGEMLFAGYGRWSVWSYVVLFGLLMMTALFVFQHAPMHRADDGTDAHPFMRRMLFALAVLLPSAIDIGLPTKHDDGYHWRDPWGKAARWTIWFHALHIAGWLFCAMIAAAIAARLAS